MTGGEAQVRASEGFWKIRTVCEAWESAGNAKEEWSAVECGACDVAACGHWRSGMRKLREGLREIRTALKTTESTGND